ncbi:MAG: hypothetical protein JW987_08340 [Anaerolineaceae bacterium]|nr:hypothetical protein [Anaerolineaceae bacterium]
MIGTILLWWAIITLIGLAALPATMVIFRRLPDQGYTLARPFGLLLAAYVLWLGASLRIIPNNWAGIAAAFSIVLFISFLALRQMGGVRAFLLRLCEQKKIITTIEALFFLAFLTWSLVRASTVYFRINPAGGEKFMEMAFLTGILNSPSFPPADPWLSGYGISYYYFGYVMMSLLTRLSGLAPEVAFDLYDATLFALTFIGAFGVVYNLIASRQNSPPRFAKAALGGLLGGLFTTVSGNLLGLIEALQARGWLPAAFVRWLAVPDLDSAQATGSFFPAGDLWWWRSSRILNDLDLFGQPIGANPITEFPFFSFLLGDNHPHVLALPFVLMAIALAFNLHLVALRGEQLSFGELLLTAISLGSLVFLNTWDYPIYLLLALLAWLAGAIARRGQAQKQDLIKTIRLALIFIAVTILAYGLFFISFSSQAGGILPYIFPPTRLPQYLIIFGPFIFILGAFLLLSLRAKSATISLRGLLGAWLRLSTLLTLGYLLLLAFTGLILAIDKARGGSLFLQAEGWLGGLPWWQVLLSITASRLASPWLFLLLTALLTLAATGMWTAITRQAPPEDQPPQPPEPGLTFTRLLVVFGLVLTFVVEFLYLRDNFGVRMNTVFKFYFQGWVCLALASAFALSWLSEHASEFASRFLRIAFYFTTALLVLCSLVYPLLAIHSRTGGFSLPPVLDGSALLRNTFPDDFAAIDWLRENTSPNAVILEAPGQSYNFEGRISAFTGRPTLLGWSYHEAQWRGSYDEQARREDDIARIFRDFGSDEADALLQRWSVQYIIIGSSEMSYLQNLCAQAESACNAERSLAQLSQRYPLVFSTDGIQIYTIPDATP